MNPVIVLGLVGSLGILVFLFELLRRRHLREKYAILWITVALVSLLLTFFPGILAWAARMTGVEIASNLLFFLAILLLLLTSIQHSFELGRLEDKTRTLAEEVALLRMELDDLRPAGDDSAEHPPGASD